MEVLDYKYILTDMFNARHKFITDQQILTNYVKHESFNELQKLKMERHLMFLQFFCEKKFMK